MARINLLPWREARRKERQRQFNASLVFAALAGAGLVLLTHLQIGHMIEHQNGRNDFLRNEIQLLDDKIKEIRKLEATREALLARMEVIQDLQANRPAIVHLFDEVVRTVPDGTYLTGLTQEDDQLSITGRAESNARVSTYMRRIEDSEWLAEPDLGVIEVSEGVESRISDFELKAEQTTPGSGPNDSESDAEKM